MACAEQATLAELMMGHKLLMIESNTIIFLVEESLITL